MKMQYYAAEPYIPYQEKAVLPAVPNKKAGGSGKAVLLLIGFFALARLALAPVIELGNDEAYYWLYTRYLQWNYFDHPPLVAVWSRLFSGNGALDASVLFVRLGSILGAALSTWAMYRAAALLYSEKAGWYAAVLYNTSLYAGIVAGLLIMPDSPQMVCWTFSIWMFARIIMKDGGWKSWLLFGLGAGLCIMSKVHGVFLWGGVGLYVVLHQRSWLLRPQLYAALLVSLVLVSPIFFWNLQYDFATYKFHSERVVVNGWSLNLQSFLEEVLGQIFFNNPVNFFLAATAVIAGGRWMHRLRHRFSFLAYMALPLMVVLLYLSLFRTVYPHWSGPAYVSLIPVSAAFLAKRSRQQLFPNWIKAALIATLLFMGGWPLVLHYYPGTWGKKEGIALGSGDVSLDRYGWEKAGKIFAQYYRQEVQRGVVAPNTPLVCNTWWGAHVEYYFGRPAGATMMGLGTLQQVHHYQWTNSLRKDTVNMQQAFCIVPSDEWHDPAKAFSNYYSTVAPVKRITLYRNGLVARHFYVYRLAGWKGGLPLELEKR
jgi:4-amino-4-deoxy-L-arabinose transferase-like glycosyltransferase